MPVVNYANWGLIPYKDAWDKQETLFAEIVNKKLQQRDLPQNQQEKLNSHLIFCEHPHVFTLGKSGNKSNLLLNDAELDEVHASFYANNRGGDITYHGPGQIVVYPVFDLEQFFTDIHKYMRYLEEAVILTMAEYGIQASRYPGLTGVWIDPETPNARKICAMGVRCSRWVTMHGLALNVNTDLSYFSHIIPCGIDDKAVTSMQKELGHEIPMDEVALKLKSHFEALFGFKLS